MNSSGRMDLGNYVTERLEHLEKMIEIQKTIRRNSMSWQADNWKLLYIEAKESHISHMERERDELKREFGVE